MNSLTNDGMLTKVDSAMVFLERNFIPARLEKHVWVL